MFGNDKERICIYDVYGVGQYTNTTRQQLYIHRLYNIITHKVIIPVIGKQYNNSDTKGVAVQVFKHIVLFDNNWG